MNAPALAFYDEEDRFYELYVRPLIPRAREDLVSQLMSGAKVYGHTMEDVLDEECQGERLFDLMALVSEVITAPTEEDTRRAVATLRLHMNNRTRAYVTPDMVEDEAYRLAQDETEEK